jgi:hypothetical protein
MDSSVELAKLGAHVGEIIQPEVGKGKRKLKLNL